MKGSSIGRIKSRRQSFLNGGKGKKKEKVRKPGEMFSIQWYAIFQTALFRGEKLSADSVGCLSFFFFFFLLPLTHTDWFGWREPADTFYPFAFHLFSFCSRNVLPFLRPFPVSFSRYPSIQELVARFSRSKPSIESHDIDILTESRRKGVFELARLPIDLSSDLSSFIQDAGDDGNVWGMELSGMEKYSCKWFIW